MRNTTDYEFPPMWGQMAPEEKDRWFTRERVFRQACRQDTAFGRRYRQHEREQERLDNDFRVDEDLE